MERETLMILVPSKLPDFGRSGGVLFTLHPAEAPRVLLSLTHRPVGLLSEAGWNGVQRLRLGARLPTFKHQHLLSQLSAWFAPPVKTNRSWGGFVESAQVKSSE